MGLGIASSIFILCSLFVFLIAQDSDARKIPTTTGREIQLNEVFLDLNQLATEGDTDILTNIMQVDGADVEVNNEHVKKDDDEDEHKKLKGKYVKEEDDDDSDDEDDDDDDDEDEDDDDDDKKKTGKQANHKDDDDEEGDDRKTEKQVDKDEHRKIIGKDVQVHKPSHMDHNHMDPELKVFFTPSDLKVGKTMPINFAKKNSSTLSPKFLPGEQADQIPFSSKQLPSLLKFFSFSKHSPQAKAMKHTLKQCEIEPREGETKFCATSLKSLLDFARYLFGSNVQFKALTTTHLTNSTVHLQNYTISEVKEISVPNIIRCHPMPYPYAVFYCHSQEGDTSVYEVLVEGQNGGRAQAAAICQMDTSKWDPGHASFRVLNVEPGTSPVCHFFPSDNIVWVPLPPAL